MLLKPLVDLKNADQITGIGRGIAFRLVEEFGLINRRDIAEDVKSLDQAGRAALRRLGVRFGAYHIFVPALIKPAPAGLITLLWALKNDGKDKPGFGDVVHALASGRTSVVVDPAFDRAFYKLAGYRPLGRRAVRVDILERLADLIRPALAWKAGLGARPDGAYDGQAFMVTPPMMSILGANADDMEEILKGLGYRAEPKPAADVKARLEALDQAAREAAAKAEAEKAEAAAKAAAEQQAEASAVTEVPVEQLDASASADAPETAAAERRGIDRGTSPKARRLKPQPGRRMLPRRRPPRKPLPPLAMCRRRRRRWPRKRSTRPSMQTRATKKTLRPSTHRHPARLRLRTKRRHPLAQAAEPIAVAEAAAAPAEEPKPILLWRPGRFERPRPAPARSSPAAMAGRRPKQAPRRASVPRGSARMDGPRSRAAAKAATGRMPQASRNSTATATRVRRSRKAKAAGPTSARASRRTGAVRAVAPKPAFQPRPREERPVQIDPLSPFAKLAALRDQLQPKK